MLLLYNKWRQEVSEPKTESVTVIKM